MADDYDACAPRSIATLRKIMKPVISTDIMGNRNVEVKAVGAWAEPALCYTSQIRMPDAVRAAELEEAKIRAMQAEKAARLRQFQTDVKKRVRQISKTKRKQQLEKDYQALEQQHQQLRASLRHSDCLTDRKDRVLVSGSGPAASGPAKHAQPASDPRSGGDTKQKPERQKKAFEKHNLQVHTYTSRARQKLSGRRVDTGCAEEEVLPGGNWESQKQTARVIRHLVDEDEDDGYLLQENESDTEELSAFRTTQTPDDESRYFSLTRHALDEKENEEEEGEKGGGGSDGGEEGEEEYRARMQRVKFNMRSVEAPNSQPGARKVSRKKAAQSKQRPTSAPDLRAGASELVEKRRQEQQKLNYRRLYSDLERQAVRDNQRRKTQRAQIRKIKQEKEAARRDEEERARRLTEPRDPVTGETSVEVKLRQQLERSHLQERLQERGDRLQKQREMDRYLDALRSNLREKMSKQGVELPALCCCGETLWDTHPDTCANNCFYYKNHRAYARALQSLLVSSVHT